jgi:hypothetical protein
VEDVNKRLLASNNRCFDLLDLDGDNRSRRRATAHFTVPDRIPDRYF